MADSTYTNPETWRKTNIIKEVRFKASLSGGKGGQNVNKVNTKIELYWKPSESYSLTEEQKLRVISKLQNKLSQESELRIVAEEERSQLKNKEKAMTKFFDLLASCFRENKKRRPTQKTKASNERRLGSKTKKKEIKSNRRKPESD